jgi:hypothetical protein
MLAAGPPGATNVGEMEAETIERWKSPFRLSLDPIETGRPA